MLEAFEHIFERFLVEMLAGGSKDFAFDLLVYLCDIIDAQFFECGRKVF